MTQLRLKYVHEFRDRHGKIRRSFRKKGQKKIPLPGLPGSPEFMEAYQAALAGQAIRPKPVGSACSVPGTISAALAGYYTSTAFTSLAAETRRTKRCILERFRADHGDKRVAKLEHDHVDLLIAAKANTPFAQRNLLKALRGFLTYCIAAKLRHDDPTKEIEHGKLRSNGYKTWDDEKIERYRAHHVLGTRPRLALELLLNIGPRRSDVVRLGHQHMTDGEIAFRAQKNKVMVEGVPVLPELAAALAAMAERTLTFLVTDYGKPYTVAGFGNWFRDQCNAAGVPVGYSAHGLRKASATRLAEAGASEKQLMAWFGWTTMREAERYTKAANNKKLARSAGDLIKTGTRSG